jgi:hypothetical protein
MFNKDRGIAGTVDAMDASEDSLHLDEVVMDGDDIGMNVGNEDFDDDGDDSDGGSEGDSDGSDDVGRRKKRGVGAMNSDGDDDDAGDEDLGVGDGDEEGEEEVDEGKSCVTEAEYMKYVRNADIEDYLKGVLWVVQMYVDGVCPDVSYTFSGRPPPTPYLIMHYIEKSVLTSIAESFDTTSTTASTSTLSPASATSSPAVTTGATTSSSSAASIMAQSMGPLAMLADGCSEASGSFVISALRQGRTGRQPYKDALTDLRARVSSPRSTYK